MELTRLVELKTGSKLGNAYYLYYLINHYKYLVKEAKKNELNNLE